MTRRTGRGRLSSIDLLPTECDQVITWAAGELRRDDRTQQAIYEEFYTKLGELMADSHGELDFQIPSKSAFNRYSIKLANLSRRIDQTREIAASLAKSFDAGSADDLTLIASSLIKTLIFETMTDAGESGLDPKETMQLAAALKSALQAEAVSTSRRQKVEKDVAGKVGEAVEKVGSSQGWTQETRDHVFDMIVGRVTS